MRATFLLVAFALCVHSLAVVNYQFQDSNCKGKPYLAVFFVTKKCFNLVDDKKEISIKYSVNQASGRIESTAFDGPNCKGKDTKNVEAGFYANCTAGYLSSVSAELKYPTSSKDQVSQFIINKAGKCTTPVSKGSVAWGQGFVDRCSANNVTRVSIQTKSGEGFTLPH
eukprot:TRINITY_DN2030_c0_g1_i1.p1 TRINITY_DN2030_c0_g1~~TRINITY_DN2030_c0_g1_i1.p1  ORF type:complete len:168 (+),score=35.82 TRINITY_DN2030_c0_g1_i1:107-610(+)